MAIVSSGQLTLTDLNDSKQLLSYIGSNQSKTVIYNPQGSVYVPNYASTNNVLTPQLFIAGTPTDIAGGTTATRWYVQTNGTGTPTQITSSGTDYTLGTGTPKTLTLKTNLLTSNQSLTYICELDYPDPKTGFTITAKSEIEIFKVTNGIDGTDGISALTGVLSNDTSVVATLADGTGGIYTGATTTMSVFIGSTDDSANWTVVATPSAGVTGNLVGKTYSVTNMTVDSGFVDLVASRSGYASITRRFSISKSRAGSGQNAVSYWLVSSTSAIKKNVSNAYVPATVTFTTKSQTGAGVPGDYLGRFIIDESIDGGATWRTAVYTSATDEASKVHTPTPQATAAINTVRVRVYLAGGTTSLIDEQIIPIVSDGTNGTNGVNAIIGVLTNETHTLPADNAGTVTNFTGANSTLTIFNGSTDDTANWTINQTRTGTGLVVTEAVTNRSATVTAIGASTDTASITFTATRSGYSNVVKTFTISKAKGGSNGSNATSYWLVAPVAISKSPTGVYNPASVTLTSMSQAGTGTPSAYAGRFSIEDSTDGTTYVNRYNSGANESTKAYTPSAGIKALRVRLHQANVTPNGSNHIDEQIIPVVADGVDSVYAYCWTPDGNAIKNSSGTLKARMDVYSGTTTVTPSAFKWYIQDPTATTVSGGDADGGNGWRLLNAGFNAGVTGYTTVEITIPASAVVGQEGFKCVATYNAIKYSAVTTVVDLSDPIVVTIIGTNTFKNGTGTVSLEAKLYQSGTEIDPLANSGYTYTWYVYDANNVKNLTALGGDGVHVGKTVTVSASDINGRGNIVCEVSK